MFRVRGTNVFIVFTLGLRLVTVNLRIHLNLYFPENFESDLMLLKSAGK